KKERKGLLWDNNPKLLRAQEILREKGSGETTVAKRGGLFRGLKQFWRVLFPSYKDLDQYIWLNQVETDFVRRSIERKRNWTRSFSGAIVVVIVTLLAAWWITDDARIEAENQKGRAEDARDVADQEREKAVEQERKARHQLAMNYWNNGFNERDSKSGSTLKALHYLAKAEEEFSSIQKDEQLAPNARLARKFIQHDIVLDKTIQYSKGKKSILSKDRRRILFWNSSGFQVADTSTGEKIADIDTKRKFRSMDFSHDGAFALAWSSGSRGNLWLYDTTNGKEYELGNNKTERIKYAKFSRDGTKALAVYHGSENGIFLIDVVNKKSIIPHKFIHNGVIGAIFNKNNSKILTRGTDGHVRVFNSNNGELLNNIKAHNDWVFGAIFSSDENRILTWSASYKEKTVRVWDISNKEGLLLNSFEHERVKRACFSNIPDKVMSWSGSSLILRDITTGKLIFNFKQKGIDGAAFDKNGERILIWSEGGIAYILDNKGNELLSINCNSPIDKAEFNADESRILTWCENGTARVWDSRNGKALSPELKHGNSIALAGFNHDESRILTSSNDGTMRIWKNNSNNSLFPLMLREENGSLYDGWVNSAIFSPDGSKVLTASNNDLTARIWSSQTGKQLAVMQGHEKGVNGAAFNTAGSQVVTWSQDGTARVWDSATGKQSVQSFIHDDDVRVGMFSSDGTKILTWTFNRKARVWDNNGQLLFPALENISRATFNTKGDRVLTWSNKAGIVQVWNADTGASLTSFRHKDVRGGLFYKNGNMILSWDNDNPIRLWDIKSKRQLASFEVTDNGNRRANNDAVTAHDDKNIFLSWNNRKIKIFTDTGLEFAYTIEYENLVSGASFNRKGDTVLSWTKNGEIDLFQLTNIKSMKAIHNKKIETMRHDAKVNGAKFNADESKILSWSKDNTARLWDSTTGKQLTPAMKHGDDVDFAEFNADESRILTRASNWDGKARIWDISLNTDWPADKVLLKVEVETGTEMTAAGEIHALSAGEWQKKRCEYDKIRYRLSPERISQEEWQISRRLCEQLEPSSRE
ncbi:MAG: hypothetical protein D3922_01930, partial [Candidatus Electrothrix sp. AR1]|nr:hypothetical protein [Candidatus Electrothrix sp. AR1]